VGSNPAVFCYFVAVSLLITTLHIQAGMQIVSAVHMVTLERQQKKSAGLFPDEATIRVLTI